MLRASVRRSARVGAAAVRFARPATAHLSSTSSSANSGSNEVDGIDWNKFYTQSYDYSSFADKSSSRKPFFSRALGLSRRDQPDRDVVEHDYKSSDPAFYNFAMKRAMMAADQLPDDVTSIETFVESDDILGIDSMARRGGENAEIDYDKLSGHGLHTSSDMNSAPFQGYAGDKRAALLDGLYHLSEKEAELLGLDMNDVLEARQTSEARASVQGRPRTFKFASDFAMRQSEDYDILSASIQSSLGKIQDSSKGLIGGLDISCKEAMDHPSWQQWALTAEESLVVNGQVFSSLPEIDIYDLPGLVTHDTKQAIASVIGRNKMLQWMRDLFVPDVCMLRVGLHPQLPAAQDLVRTVLVAYGVTPEQSVDVATVNKALSDSGMEDAFRLVNFFKRYLRAGEFSAVSSGHLREFMPIEIVQMLRSISFSPQVSQILGLNDLEPIKVQMAKFNVLELGLDTKMFEYYVLNRPEIFQAGEAGQPVLQETQQFLFQTARDIMAAKLGLPVDVEDLEDKNGAEGELTEEEAELYDGIHEYFETVPYEQLVLESQQIIMAEVMDQIAAGRAEDDSEEDFVIAMGKHNFEEFNGEFLDNADKANKRPTVGKGSKLTTGVMEPYDDGLSENLKEVKALGVVSNVERNTPTAPSLQQVTNTTEQEVSGPSAAQRRLQQSQAAQMFNLPVWQGTGHPDPVEEMQWLQWLRFASFETKLKFVSKAAEVTSSPKLIELSNTLQRVEKRLSEGVVLGSSAEQASLADKEASEELDSMLGEKAVSAGSSEASSAVDADGKQQDVATAPSVHEQDAVDNHFLWAQPQNVEGAGWTDNAIARSGLMSKMTSLGHTENDEIIQSTTFHANELKPGRWESKKGFRKNFFQYRPRVIGTNKAKVPSPHNIDAIMLMLNENGTIIPRKQTKIPLRQYKKFARVIKTARQIGYVPTVGGNIKELLQHGHLNTIAGAKGTQSSLQ